MDQFQNGQSPFKKPKSFIEKFKSLFQPKIISPVPESQILDEPGKLSYAAQDVARKEAARMPQPTFTPRKLEYPEWMANAPTAPIKKDLFKETPISTVTPTPKPQIPSEMFKPSESTFKFQDVTDKVSKELGLKLQDYHLLRAGENMAENPQAINKNNDGTVDIGLYQINVAADNTAEIERLKDPEYNTRRAGQIWRQRLKTLEDPVLAIASYNLGAGGAVLRPEDALKRAQWVYWKAGMDMPETEFTKDPQGYVNKRMDRYKKIGLYK